MAYCSNDACPHLLTLSEHLAQVMGVGGLAAGTTSQLFKTEQVQLALNYTDTKVLGSYCNLYYM